MKNKGHKLKDVAETLDISAPRVTDILKGDREVQADEVLPLASLLGMTAEALLKSLKAGMLVDAGTAGGNNNRLTVKGRLMGDGQIEPLVGTNAPREVAVPADAETTEGLMAFILGDNALEQEIRAGSIIIAGDPRIHHYPMTPGSIFLVKRTGKDGKEQLAPRQYHRTDDGGDWMVAITNRPNPAFQSWPFIMTPAPQGGTSDDAQNPVYTDDIVGAVMWVHRRYKP